MGEGGRRRRSLACPSKFSILRFSFHLATCASQVIMSSLDPGRVYQLLVLWVDVTRPCESVRLEWVL